MSKRLALVLALVLAITLVAGCGGAGGEKDPGTTTGSEQTGGNELCSELYSMLL
jgi:hypothetical protein